LWSLERSRYGLLFTWYELTAEIGRGIVLDYSTLRRIRIEMQAENNSKRRCEVLVCRQKYLMFLSVCCKRQNTRNLLWT